MSKKIVKLTIISILALVLMYYVEAFIRPGFLIKSILKLGSFSLAILIYYKTSRDNIRLFNFSDINKSSFKTITFIAIAVFFLILIGYYLMKDFIDLSNIKDNLLEKEKITKDTFLYVALYISFINSLLEEIFFRGFIFGEMKNQGFRKLGYIVSPVLFALYHIAIIDSWFTLPIFLLFTIGLVGVGIVFNYIYERSNTFIGPWLIHIMANFGINTIGFIMLGII